MKHLLTIMFAVAALMLVACPALAAPLTPTWLYSTDLGSDLDLSDPVTPVNNWMDCGAIYVPQGVPGQPLVPVLWKDDDGPAVWTGWPFQMAPQPAPGQIGAGQGQPGISPEPQYMEYFDLDAEDQLREPVEVGMIKPCIEFQDMGVYRPVKVFLSFEDDGAPGWYISGDVPTTAAPDHAFEIFRCSISCTPPLPANVVPLVTEDALGLGPPPLPIELDDDVDALDLHELDGTFRYRYFSPDHEANLGLDPGGIYLTVNGMGQNVVKVFDDVANFGVPEETDIDAFEFLAVDDDCLVKLQQQNTALFAGIVLNPGDCVLGAIFSVDQNDPDNDIGGVITDESGGLNPNVIYLTDLMGQFVAVSGVHEEDIDALAAIPEPATALLLVIGGLMLCAIRRKR